MNLSCEYDIVFHDNQQNVLKWNNFIANALYSLFVFELSLQQKTYMYMYVAADISSGNVIVFSYLLDYYLRT